jgi:hypothetical protein
MSGTETIHEHTTPPASAATVDLKLEVVIIPVADVDRAEALLRELGLATGRRLRH